MLKSLNKYKFEYLLGIIILIYIVLFSYLSIHRYLALNSHYFDLGIMNQVVYNTSRGWLLEMTNQDLKKNVSRLAIHFDPILAAFAPFYKLYEGPAGPPPKGARHVRHATCSELPALRKFSGG